MSKPTRLVTTKAEHISARLPFVVFVGFLGLGLVGYVLSQALLPVEAHLSHWMIAGLSALVGGVLGWLWYRWRGDII